MKIISLLYILVCFSTISWCNKPTINGTWQGTIVQKSLTISKSIAFWINFSVDKSTNTINGTSRIETPYTDYYALKSFSGKIDSKGNVEFEEIMLGNQKNSGSKSWCLLNAKLNYIDSTGYLEGNYFSSDCRSNIGTIKLFKSKYEMSVSDTVSKYHSWVTNFDNDIKRGWPAYYIRDEIMKNFEILPVYFKHDKYELNYESIIYLKKMVAVVNSHTDLRIKIIGHTDSNGSDNYNYSLSKKRADMVKEKLIEFGIEKDRVVFEFRGEKDPAVSNLTFNGKKLNRRVDFEFI